MDWAALIQLVLKLVGWLLDVGKASSATKQQFLNLVQSVRDEALVPTQGRDEFADQDKKLGIDKKS